MKKTVIMLIILIILLFCLVGCGDGLELQKMGLVLGMGLDLKEMQGKQQLYLTVEIANYNRQSSEIQPKAGDNIFHSYGRTVADAIAGLNNSINKDLFWGHCKIIILGEEVVNSGVFQYMDLFLRSNKLRPTTLIFTTAGEAGEIFKGKSGLAPVVSYGIVGLFDHNNNENIADKNNFSLQRFSENMLFKYAACILPIVNLENNNEEGSKQNEKNNQDEKNIRIDGYAIISTQGKWVLTLNAQEALGMFIWRNALRSSVVTAQIGDNNYTVQVYSPHIKLNLKDNVIMLHMSVLGELYEAELPLGSKQPVDLNQIRERVIAVLKEAVNAAYKKEIESGYDFLCLGEYLYRHEQNFYKQMQNFPACLTEIKSEIKLDIISHGAIYNSI